MDISEKIYGCYLGKNIGGTLGMPYEGIETFLKLDYYQPVPEHPAPNDDIDLQLVWLEAFKEHGVALTSDHLADYWLRNMDAHWDEYGIALWNLKKGLPPPRSGLHNNFFVDGLGAAIRSELWASLFPGKPLTAAYFAYIDAVVDHAGDGVYAEVFLAAAQSQLYESGDVRGSVEYGLSLLPDSSRLKEAMLETLCTYDSGASYEQARQRAMDMYGSVNFTDCVMNLPFALLGLLYGKGNFSDTILYAVNCGQDADCTAATAGAFLGIVLGKDGIPPTWSSKVGDQIVVGDYIKGIKVNTSIRELVSDILRHQPAGGALPEIQLPFVLPPVVDVSDGNAWLADGEPVALDGVKLSAQKYGREVGKPVSLKTEVCFDTPGDIQLMVASRGLFRCWWNGRDLGCKGNQDRPVPAIHRTRGGRNYNLMVEAGRKYALEIVLNPTYPVPDMYVAFADMHGRYLSPRYSAGSCMS